MAYISKFTGAQIDALLDQTKKMQASKEDKANKVTSINADADDVHYPTAKAVKDSLEKVKNIEVTPDMLSESTKQFINASIGGTITNFADDEDLTTVDNALKLADKTYDPITYSGMGRKYLRKNLVDGKNILTQEMLPSANTIYIIQYDYDLNGATITIPANCILDFQGGSLANGTVVGSNSDINSNPSTIFSNDLTISGSWRKNEWNIKWFGALGDGISDDTAAINAATKIPYATLLFPAGQYLISSTIDGYETSQAWIGAECTHLSTYSASQTNEMASTIKCVGDNNGEPFVYCPKVLKNFGIFGERANTTTPLYQNTIGMRMNKPKQFANQIIIDNLKVAYFGLGILHTTGFSNRINELRIDRCYVGLDLSSEVFKGVDSGYITLLHISNYSIDNCITAAINRGILGDTGSSICNIEFSHGVIESNGAPMITTGDARTQGGSFIFNFLYSEETDEFCDVKGLSIRLINSHLRTNKIRLDYGILYMENTFAANAIVELTQYELLSFNSHIKELSLPTNRPGRTADSQIYGLILNNQNFNLYKLPAVSDLKQTRPFGFGTQNQSAGVLGFDTTNKVPVAWIDNTAKWRGFDGYTPSAKGGDIRPTLASDDIGKQFFDTTLNKPIWWTGSAWVDATGATV